MSANSDISVVGGVKDYSNSKTKVDGKYYGVGASHKYADSKVVFGYSKHDTDRENPVTKAPLTALEIKKYNLNYSYNVNEKLTMKAGYIKILDNLAPTDQGKVYGIGATYRLSKGFGIGADIYKSDYEQFDVNQYDLSVFKGFKIGDIKAKATVIAKAIKIEGDKYGSYTFKDKDYFTTGLKLGMSYNGYSAGIGTFLGKRLFTVLGNGQKVQHHAMEQDRTYMLSLGKKFKDFNIALKYSFQNGNELPENRDDVDQKVTSFMIKYRF